MPKFAFVLLLATAAAAYAEVHPMTLPQALDLASRQNPDIELARLDQQHAEQGILVAKDPFRPKIYGGSGLAYTYGYPNTIQGDAPSIFEAKTDMAVYNRPKMFELAAAKETARGAQLGAQSKSDEVAYRIASVYLDAQQAEHSAQTLLTELPSLQKVIDVMQAQIREGTELPLEAKRSKLTLAEYSQRLDAARLDADYLEMMLAVGVGFPSNDRIKPVDAQLPAMEPPQSEEQAAEMAIRNNRELRQMQSNVLAKELELQSYRAARYPQVNLVAQYALFAKYTYDQYFSSSKFQRNNGQLGASITIPLWLGPASQGLAAQATTDMQKLRIQMNQVRDRVTTDSRRSYQQWKKAQEIRDVARMQLDVAREDLSVRLAQNGEGRLPMSSVEQARVEESNRWLSLFEAETQVTRSELAIFRQMGTLMMTLRGTPPEPQP